MVMCWRPVGRLSIEAPDGGFVVREYDAARRGWDTVLRTGSASLLHEILKENGYACTWPQWQPPSGIWERLPLECP